MFAKVAKTIGKARSNIKNGTDEKKMQDTNSEFQEHSHNSRMEMAVETFEVKFEEKPTEKRTLLSGSEFREHSRESRTNPQTTIETETIATVAEE